jgi:hypothetical protein
LFWLTLRLTFGILYTIQCTKYKRIPKPRRFYLGALFVVLCIRRGCALKALVGVKWPYVLSGRTVD